MTDGEFSKHKKCLLCGSTSLQAMKGYESCYLVQCKDCDFVFTERIPTVEELIAHYSSYGRNDYLSPITVKRYEEILDFLEPYRKTNKIIDVGCGIGHFLEVAKKRGWDVYGTEFTEDAIAICEARGIQMQKGKLDPANYAAEAFDVIVSFEVIEHIYNPNEELENFDRILRPGGAVYITTPNFNSISRLYLKDKWSVIEYPEHLSYYTASSLNRILKAHGFRKKWIKTTGISLTRLEGTLAKSNPSTEAPEKLTLVGSDTTDEKLRTRMETNPLLKLAKGTANFVLNTFRKGESMKGLFEKAS